MSARQPIIIDGREFKTQKALHEHLRAIRDRCPDGATVQPPDDRFMYHALKRHHDWRAKFGPGISRFVVDSDGRNGRCFYAVTIAGTRVSFAMDACVTGRPKDSDQDSRAAARDTIADQIREFKDATLWWVTSACAYCLGPFDPTTDIHVDHRPPRTFARLWEVFKQRFPHLDITAISAETERIGERKFRGSATTAAWRDFHQQHARLRLVHKRCNLSAIRKVERCT